MTETRDGRFRLYRVFPEVLHVNLQDVKENQLYTVHQSGYPESLQEAVDDLRTGDLLTGTLEGDPENEEEAWTLTAFERTARVEFGFTTDVGEDLPGVARELWGRPDRDGPAGAAIAPDEADDPVAECWVQPLDALPGPSLSASVLSGLLPLEPWLTDLPHVGEVPVEVLVLDPGDPEGRRRPVPFGVFLFFPEAGRELADTYRERYGIERGVDTRPDLDPY